MLQQAIESFACYTSQSQLMQFCSCEKVRSFNFRLDQAQSADVHEQMGRAGLEKYNLPIQHLELPNSKQRDTQGSLWGSMEMATHRFSS